MKRRIVNFFQEADLGFIYLMSAVSIILLLALGNLFYRQNTSTFTSYCIGGSITLLCLLDLILYQYKRRCLYDPKLRTIRVNSLEAMRPYVGRLFLVDPHMQGDYTIRLEDKGFCAQQSTFILFTPTEIDFFQWNNQMKVLGNQRLSGIMFFTDNGKGDGKICYRLYVLNSTEEFVFKVA
jgi:hypothetical protein